MHIGRLAFMSLLAVGSLLQALPARADPAMRMLYYERKPFHYTLPDGKVTGLVVGPTEAAFAKLGIPIQWALVPANRILLQLETNAAAECSPGWYRKPEREVYARFSAPIYRDRPLVGLARADARFEPNIMVQALLSRPDTKLLVKSNFSQGAYMDALIAKMPPGQVSASAMEVQNLVKMIHAGRADLIITTQEEVDLYVKQAELAMTDFRVLVFPDVPAVEMRYILCSKQVPAELMDRLNATISETMRLNR